MPKATLTKRTEFCASHRYHNTKWDDEKNRKVFGPCNNIHSHGHNYLLEATFEGPIDPVTGMIINLYDLKIILNQILEEFDHKNLNLDTSYFTTRIPTSENLTSTLWEILQKHPDLPDVYSLRLYEDHTLYAQICAQDLDHTRHIHRNSPVLIARRYKFSATYLSHGGQERGHNYEMWVALKGPVDEETGQIINLSTLDDTVQTNVLTQWHMTNLSRNPVFSASPVTDSSLAVAAWKILTPVLSPHGLFHVSVSQQEETSALASR
jgi:6-pyruvoyltetrahydropterin/6-carboxytetrahydropterin synthase